MKGCGQVVVSAKNLVDAHLDTDPQQAIKRTNLQESKNLGRCLINSANEEADPNRPDQGKPDPNDYVVQIKILPSGQHILCATKNGQVFLIYVESW